MILEKKFGYIKKMIVGNYIRYVYIVEASYEVKPSQVDIMLPWKFKI